MWKGDQLFLSRLQERLLIVVAFQSCAKQGESLGSDDFGGVSVENLALVCVLQRNEPFVSRLWTRLDD